MLNPAQYKDSLKKLKTRVYLEGKLVPNVADEPAFRPGINAIALSYEYAANREHQSIMTGPGHNGNAVHRFLTICRTSDDLLKKLQAIRMICRIAGCGQRYLAQDALNALMMTTHDVDVELGTDYTRRFTNYLDYVQTNDLAPCVAMTDAKGDRSKRPSEQSDPDMYLRIVEKNDRGILVNGAKAIVTAAPYAHEVIVLPTRSMTQNDGQYAASFAVPADAEGLKMIARPAGRPFAKDAAHSSEYGQSTAMLIFEKVFVPWERVFLAGEWAHAGKLARGFATFHRLSCIGCRAGLGDILIGAAASAAEHNGLNLETTTHIRDRIADLIGIVESFYSAGVSASVLGTATESGVFSPNPVYANLGKLELGTKIYDMYKLVHEIAGGLVVTQPSTADEENPETSPYIQKYLAANSSATQRSKMLRLIEDLTGSSQSAWFSVISMQGGGPPQAEKIEIVRKYDLTEKKQLAEKLAGGHTDENVEAS
ncbi:MAG: 4-hydroxyphenylacetate 3-hydroxylase family protein [Candidatus Bathyarchaeia archaeon]